MANTVAALPQKEIDEKLKSLPKWSCQGKALVRVVKFPTYLEALDFVNKLGQAAEKEDHHPDILMEYKTVTIKFSTHSENGITNLDFKMAAVADELIKNSQV